MTTLTLRYIKGDFVVTGPDIEPARFKTRREAKDWCVAHYPGSPIKEIGPIYRPPSAERRAVTRGGGELGPLNPQIKLMAIQIHALSFLQPFLSGTNTGPGPSCDGIALDFGPPLEIPRSAREAQNRARATRSDPADE